MSHLADTSRAVRVWDLPTRLFHWGLVAAVAGGLLTGYVAPEWWMGAHLWAGYALAGLIAFRLVWGLFGSEYSRIASFLYHPRETLEHLRGLFLLRPRHYIGHNPAGALMIFALAALLLGLVVTGLLAAGGEEGQGPLAGLVSFATGDAAKQVHSTLVLILLALVAGHVAGVLAESRLAQENLTLAMITGEKTLRSGQEAPQRRPRPARPLAAALAMGLLLAAAAGGIVAASKLPVRGMYALIAEPSYDKECGACHHAFHPSLMSEAAWRLVMASLNDHFGEDASLKPELAARIESWLAANASERWDTEAANRLRQPSQAEPRRITATRYWARKHRDISERAFAQKSVGGKANCQACHADAASGRYDDQAIRIPAP
jgi:cytochrome b